MDLITHAVLGALTGEWMLGKRLGNRALAWGALIGATPDLLDLIPSPFLDTAASLWWRHGPGHSLLAAAVAAWALSRWLVKPWKKDKITRTTAAGFVLAIWLSHVLVDCFTTEGVALCWPFPAPRVAFNFMHWIDPLFSFPMAVALIRLAFLRTKKQLPQRRRFLVWGTGVAAVYALLCIGMKFTASAGFDADLLRRGVKYQRRMETPTGFNGLLWRSVADRGDELWVGYRTVFELHSTPVRWTIYPKGCDALAGMEKSRQTLALTNISDGWWIARRHARGAWLADVRVTEERVWGDKKTMVDSRFPSAWDIMPTARGDHLRRLYPTRSDPGAMFRRMISRTFGNRAAWEDNPRLAGVTGSLPEFLAVEP